MIGLLGSKRVTALQQDITELDGQVTAMASSLASTLERLAMVNDELIRLNRRLEDQAITLALGEQRIETLTNMLHDQAVELLGLKEQEEQRRELDRRTRADMIRIERQATIDTTALRETCLTLAERFLTGRERNSGT